MKNTALLLTLLISASLYAQIGFQQNIIIDESYGVINPNAVISADIDGDGLNDVVSSGNRELVWFKNLGNGNFGKENKIYQDATLFGVQAENLDNDNDNDLVYFLDSNAGVQIVWQENLDGQGDFGAPQVLAVNDFTSPIGFEIVDVDFDNDPDIVFGYRGFIGWLENNNSSFNFNLLLGNTATTSSNYQGFTAVDINGDNLKDFVVDIGYDLRVYPQESDGSLSFLGTISTFAQGDFVTSGDLDNDGDQDIVRIFENGGGDRSIRLYENTDGLGSFTNAQTIISLDDLNATSNSDTKSLQLIDINSDNLLDIVFHESRTKTLSTYLNLGNNTFGDEVVVANDIVNLNSIFVGRLDEDLYVDILTTSRNDNQISWFKNINGQGSFSNENPITSYAYFINHVDAGDLDGDGDLDIVSSSHADNKLAWYANTNGLGEFSDNQRIISKTFPAPRNAFIVDLNGDDFNDILFFSYLDDNPDEYKIIWLQNDGTGQFIQENIIDNVEEQILRLQYADIDNDDDLDIISAEDDSVLKLYKNNGDGTFEAAVTFSEPGFYYPLSLQVGDVDNDGDTDVLASYNNNEIVWYENTDGMGNLNSKNIITPQMGYPSSIYLADINGDNFKDLVFSNKFSDEVGYFLNTDGLGNFGPKQLISSNVDNPSAVYVQDVDGDGDQDIVTNAESNARLLWFENEGDANFSEAIEITVNAERVNHITSADFNSDGKPDLLTSSYDDDQIAWYDNLGTFTNAISGIVKLDANADGCDDNDAGIANLLITTENDTNSFATFTQADGSYNFQANQQAFTTTINSTLPPYYQSNPETQTNDFTNLNGSAVASDFCVEASQSINEVSVVIYPDVDDPRPGFDTSYRLVYANNGTTPLSGTISFTYDDSKLQFLSASESVSTSSAGVLSFDYSDLNPFETQIIDLEFNVFAPPTTNIGEVLVSSASINPIFGDITEDDNSFELNQTVIGSFDPNDIRVLEGDEVLIEEADKYLHYIIRFQNTGTASAINVRVEHILDDKLDWTTIKLQSLSHDGRVEITNGSDIQFIFNGINLPDSNTDEPNSHGFIAFKIKPKNDVVTGDVISGVADIYFDFNPPITTNTVNTEFVETLDNENFTAHSISLYPNPVKTTLNLSTNKAIENLKIYANTGRLVKDLILKNSNKTLSYKIDIEDLASGLYFMEVLFDNTRQFVKFIKH